MRHRGPVHGEKAPEVDTLCDFTCYIQAEKYKIFVTIFSWRGKQ